MCRSCGTFFYALTSTTTDHQEKEKVSMKKIISRFVRTAMLTCAITGLMVIMGCNSEQVEYSADEQAAMKEAIEEAKGFCREVVKEVADISKDPIMKKIASAL
jgi:hypothetical protein